MQKEWADAGAGRSSTQFPNYFFWHALTHFLHVQLLDQNLPSARTALLRVLFRALFATEKALGDPLGIPVRRDANNNPPHFWQS